MGRVITRSKTSIEAYRSHLLGVAQVLLQGYSIDDLGGGPLGFGQVVAKGQQVLQGGRVQKVSGFTLLGRAHCKYRWGGVWKFFTPPQDAQRRDI